MKSVRQNSLSFIDVISVASFLIGLENLDLNISQEDLQHLETDFNEKLESSLKDIHDHLAVQDAKLNTILDILGGMKNDS